MHKEFEDQQHVARYFNQCIAMYDGVPVLCIANGREQVQHIHIVPLAFANDAPRLVPVADPLLCVDMPEIGYVNFTHEGRAAHIGLRPSRAQKIGIPIDYLMCTSTGHGLYDLAQKPYPPLADMLVNKYPTYAEARKKILDDAEISGIAFSKHLSIQRVRKIFVTMEHRGVPIAEYNRHLQKFMLLSERRDNSYIREILKKANVLDVE